MYNSSEKLCLKWNDFKQNVITSYHDLRKDSDFCDVTLVCEESEQIEAHRIILTACSPFFNTVLKKNKHSHPLIYMRGIKVRDLVAILDFLYHGKANIYQEDLEGFLALAEELKLKGLEKDLTNFLDDSAKNQLEGPNNPKHQIKTLNIQEKFLDPLPTHEEADQTNLNRFFTFAEEQQLKGLGGDQINCLTDGIKKPLINPNNLKPKSKTLIRQEKLFDPVPASKEVDTIPIFQNHLGLSVNAGGLLVPLDTTNENLKHHLDTMMTKAKDGAIKWVCTVCGKEIKGKSWGLEKFHMRDHIETHIEGLSYPCNQCGKVTKTSSSLRTHMTYYHKK